MQTLTLRDYQQNLIDRLYRQQERGRSKVMIQSPTGSGKSKLFSQLAIDARVGFKKRVLILAHTEELVLQNAAHLESYLPGQVGIIKAGVKKSYHSPVQSASIQTIVNRLDKVGNFDLVIHDEAHHCSSNTSRKIIEHYHSQGAKIVGLTATPIRTDGKGFDDIFEVLETGISTAELIAKGYLSRYFLQSDPRPMQTTTRLKNGDYDLEDLARLNNAKELAGGLVANYLEHANGGSCIVFAINLEHSIEIAKNYNEAGIPAIHLDAKTDKETRRSALAKLAAGEIKVISNVGLFGEGVDVPSLNCVQIARPTKSIGLHLQMLGRVLRMAEGKELGLILDHTDNCVMLGLPDDAWEWKLEGKPKKEKVAKDPKEIEIKKQIDRDKGIIQELKELKLVQIASRADGEKYWDDLLDRFKYQQQTKGKTPQWVRYQMAAKYPPQRIWEKIAEHIGKPQSWGIQQYQQQAREAATEALRAVVKLDDPSRAIAAVRTKWQDRELLKNASRFLLAEQRGKLKEIVEADNQTRLGAGL
jgi:superfamily II DNA or RNA helicase